MSQSDICCAKPDISIQEMLYGLIGFWYKGVTLNLSFVNSYQGYITSDLWSMKTNKFVYCDTNIFFKEEGMQNVVINEEWVIFVQALLY